MQTFSLKTVQLYDFDICVRTVVVLGPSGSGVNLGLAIPKWTEFRGSGGMG